MNVSNFLSYGGRAATPNRFFYCDNLKYNQLDNYNRVERTMGNSKRVLVLVLAAGVVLGLVLAGVLLREGHVKGRSRITTASTSSANADEVTLLPDEKNTIAVFQEAAPSVVFITNSALQLDYFSMDVMEIPQGSGSGFIWDSKGHVVTNYHVIANANSLSVALSDGSTFPATVVGAEPSKDLAVLKIQAPESKLKPVTAGRSERLVVGQKVIAIGNPFGLDQTLTVGVVSALGRQIQSANRRTIHDVIQTDAAINPGNSGGPLLDSQGRLIGVNTAIVSPSGAYAGIGFAVPVNTVRQIVPQLIQYGKVIRPGLGVTVVSDSVARRLDVEGVIIGEVPEGSEAQQAGLQGINRNWRGELSLGDVVTHINEDRITNTDELANALEQHKVGDTVTVKLLRDGKESSIRLRLVQLN